MSYLKFVTLVNLYQRQSQLNQIQIREHTIMTFLFPNEIETGQFAGCDLSNIKAIKISASIIMLFMDTHKGT